MPDHGGGGAGRDGEVDIEQDLALRFITEVHGREGHAGALRGQRRGVLAVGHFAVFVEQREQAFHVGQALLDLAVDHAKEVERNVQLDHEGIDQYQVAQRHAAGDDALGGAPQDQRDGGGDDQRLARVEKAERGLRADRRALVVFQSLVVAPGFIVLVAEVLDGFVVD